MGILTNTIGDSAFELIRDRIAAILADELPIQAQRSNDDSLKPTVFTERWIPVGADEGSVIIVHLAQIDYDKQTRFSQTGSHEFWIDCYQKAKSSEATRADKESRLKLHRLMAVCHAILSDAKYDTLAFSPPFIENTEVSKIMVSNPENPKEYKSRTLGRLIFNVRCPEIGFVDPPGSIAGWDTTVNFFENDKGYFWSKNSEE